MEISKKRVALVVDDSKLNRQIIIEYLQAKEFTILEAEDGKNALEMIEAHKPDIVLLDLIMPIMDGFETLAHLRAMGNTVPVIVITAYLKENTYQRCRDLGAKGFVNKPIKMQDLYNQISAIIES